jgi:hypothetical protein
MIAGIEPVTDPLETVILAVPEVTAVTKPLLSTVATAALSEVHVKVSEI